MKNPLPAVVALCALAPSVFAESAPASKTYSPIFAPIAIEDRRALSVDRSNFVYAASGINSGVLQLESSVIEYTQDDHIPGVDGRFTQYNFGTATLRVGILDNFELKATLAAHVMTRFKDAAGAVTEDEGLGDTTLETRYTFCGNSGETVGCAIVPYVKLPTNTLEAFNDRPEFGTQVPVTILINERITLCTAAGFDVNYNGESVRSYDVNPFFATALWYAAAPELAFFNEWYVKKNTGAGKDDWNSYVGLGGVWSVSRDFDFDMGVNFGLAEVAPDLYARMGVTYRF